MLHVTFWRRRNYAYEIISLLFFVWTRGKLLFCFVFFPCCYKPALLEGALLHFIPPTTTNNHQSLSPPPLSLQAASRAIGPRPALQPQRWARTPQGTREEPTGAWAVVSHRVGQRAGMLNAIWPCHSHSGNRVGRGGRSKIEREDYWG